MGSMKLIKYEEYHPYIEALRYHNYGYYWPDGDPESDWSKFMAQIKSDNTIDFWKNFRYILKHDIDTLPMEHFRSWASIIAIPFVTNARFAEPALNAFMTKGIGQAMRESWIGVAPENIVHLKVFLDYDISYLRCQNMMPIVRHNLVDVIKNNEIKSIIEIGGGYGDMSLMIRQFGYTGHYTIYDLPEVNIIQKYFLSNHNVNQDTKLTSNLDELGPADLVIATWSITEIPLDLRNQIFNKLKNSKGWLLTHENEIFGINNQEWVDKAFKHHHKQIDPCQFYKTVNAVSGLYTNKEYL
jgi:hypothetical protein